MTPAAVRQRFRAVVARALERAEREQAEHLDLIRSTPVPPARRTSRAAYLAQRLRDRR